VPLVFSPSELTIAAPTTRRSADSSRRDGRRKISADVAVGLRAPIAGNSRARGEGRRRRRDDVRADLRADLVSQLWIMLGATLFVFLLACANVANIVTRGR
jgi:hypothetical protein